MARTLRQDTTPRHCNRTLRLEVAPRQCTRTLRQDISPGHCAKGTAQGHCTRTLPQVTAPGHCAKTVNQDTTPGQAVFSLLARTWQQDAAPRNYTRTARGHCSTTAHQGTPSRNFARTLRQDATLRQDIAHETGHRSKCAPGRFSATVCRPQYTTLGPRARTLRNADLDF